MALSIGKQLTAEQRLYKATTDIVGREEFVALAGVLMIGTKSVVDGLPTACTNGRDEMYGREFVEGLSDAEFRFLILHECYHKMYRHLTTWKHLWDKNKQKANFACDHVINLKIVDTEAGRSGWIKMPEGGLYNPEYVNLNAKQVWDLLPDDEQSEGGQGDGTGNDSHGGFDEHDWEGAKEMNAQEAEALAKEIDEALRQGAVLAGKVGSGGDRLIGELLETRKNWKELLREYVSATCTGKDYSTWRKPNRRYVGMGMLMPSSISESVGELVLAIDTSGSIGQQELNKFLTEVKGVCDQVHPSKVHIMYWDTAVCKHEIYLDTDVENLVKSTKPEGGGGTMVECVPQYLNEHGIKPECVIVLTDGWLGGSWGQWTVPVLWCVQGNKQAKPTVGSVVHID